MRIGEENSRKEEILEIEERMAELPVGHVVYKTIKGKRQPYLQWTENGKTISKYLKKDDRERILAQVEERKQLSARRRVLRSTVNEISAAAEREQAEEYRTNVSDGPALQAMIRVSGGRVP